ncbi:MAG: NAD-binding protein [Pirellulaceae bacterium]
MASSRRKELPFGYSPVCRDRIGLIRRGRGSNCICGCRVTGLDSSRRNIETYKDSLYEAVIGDARSAEVIEQLGVGTADGVVVSLGEDLHRVDVGGVALP